MNKAPSPARIESALMTWERVLLTSQNYWLLTLARRNILELSGALARMARESAAGTEVRS